MYNSSNPAVFSESFTIYLLVKIKNEISRYYYFCKYNGINRVSMDVQLGNYAKKEME